MRNLLLLGDEADPHPLSRLGNPACLSSAREAPNILILLGDDCTYNDLPTYGGPGTPNLPSKGWLRRVWFLTGHMSPLRCANPAGQACVRNVSDEQRMCLESFRVPSGDHRDTRLGKLGYRVGLAGKRHIRPSVFPFRRLPVRPIACTDPRRDDLEPARAFRSKEGPTPRWWSALTEPRIP